MTKSSLSALFPNSGSLVRHKFTLLPPSNSEHVCLLFLQQDLMTNETIAGQGARQLASPFPRRHWCATTQASKRLQQQADNAPVASTVWSRRPAPITSSFQMPKCPRTCNAAATICHSCARIAAPVPGPGSRPVAHLSHVLPPCHQPETRKHPARHCKKQSSSGVPLL